MTTAKASDPMGLKRICTNCGTRFYDMNKRPIVCPSCETEFTIETKLKGRRGRASIIDTKSVLPSDNEDELAKMKAYDEDDDILEDEDDGVEAVSLDDMDEGSVDEDEDEESSVLDDDDTLDDIPDFDDELGDDLEDDDTLLEEED